MRGAFGEEHSSNPEIEKLIERARPEILKNLGHEAGVIKVLSYQKQIVAGTNYKVKANIKDKIYHIELFHELPCNGGHVQITEFFKDN